MSVPDYPTNLPDDVSCPNCGSNDLINWRSWDGRGCQDSEPFWLFLSFEANCRNCKCRAHWDLRDTAMPKFEDYEPMWRMHYKDEWQKTEPPDA